MRFLIERDDGRETVLGWWCACGTFNGSAKEQLAECRCCCLAYAPQAAKQGPRDPLMVTSPSVIALVLEQVKREREGISQMKRWGIWYDAGDCNMGWLQREGSHGRPTTFEDDIPRLREQFAIERENDLRAVRSGWPATTHVIGEIGSAPLRCLLDCPKCGVVHIDEGEWETRKHKTHQCQACKHEWRPFAYPTVGVAAPAESEASR